MRKTRSTSLRGAKAPRQSMWRSYLRKHFLTFAIAMTSCPLYATPEKLTLALDWYMTPPHAPLYVAQKYGFFTRHNLDVELIIPSQAQTAPKMVAAKKLDLVLSYQYHYHLFLDKGLPLTRIATLVPTPMNCLTVRKDTGIKTPSDLKGKKIGFRVGLGTSRLFIETMLKKAGLQLKDVELIHAKKSLSTGFLSKQLDAITGGYRTVEPFLIQARNMPVTTFNYEDYGVPAYEELIILSHQDTQNSSKIKAFIAALTESICYLKKNSKVVLQDFLKDHKDQNPTVTTQIWNATIPLFTDTPGAYDEKKYKEFAGYLRKNGLIK